MLKSIFILLISAILNFAQVEELTVISFDNTPIVYQKNGSGEQTLVFVHCWSCDKSYWQSTIEYLSGNYRTIAIDLAGHGDSGLERTEWTIENYAKDVLAVIENENLTDVILIGHSMGGPVILSTAQQAGNKVKALIAIDTFQDIENEPTEEQFEEFFEPFEKDFESSTKYFVKSIFGENADSSLVVMISNDMSMAPPDVALFSFRSLFEFREAPVFDQIQIPVRFINSEKFSTNQEAAERHISDFELIIIEGVGHFPMLENPVEFNSVLETTIEKLFNN